MKLLKENELESSLLSTDQVFDRCALVQYPSDPPPVPSKTRFWLGIALLSVFIAAILCLLIVYYQQAFATLIAANSFIKRMVQEMKSTLLCEVPTSPGSDPSQKSDLPIASDATTFNQTEWSTYRPQLYFGLKNRRIDSPVFGLMWYRQGVGKVPSEVPLRHWALHEDNVVFMWNMHDGTSFGSQPIKDAELSMRTDWLSFGKSSWMARLDINRPQWTQQESFVLYFALQDEQSQLKMNSPSPISTKDFRFLEGQSEAVRGKFAMNVRSINPGQTNWTMSAVGVRGQPFVDMAQVSELVKSELQHQPDGTFAFGDKPAPADTNFAALQITSKANSIVEILFLAGEDESPSSFEEVFEKRDRVFHARFNELFPIPNDSAIYQKMGHAALSNLLGGIGVWHGNCSIRSRQFSPPDSVRQYGPFSLISAVPARTGFPRGFIWDEGFHNLLIHKFDPALTIQIISAYLDMMNVDGWIPREIAIGTEAVARIPGSFLVQEDWVANPPMFFYVLREMINDPKTVEQFKPQLNRMYPRVKQLYIWLRDTQRGPRPGTMRWHDRNQTTNLELNPGCLSSGFDDYPRATHPTDEEYHLDLRCWMAMSSTVLAQLAQIADDADFVPVIREESVLLNDLQTLDELYWSERAQRYCDYGLHSESVKLVPEKTPEGETILVRKVLKEPHYGFVENVNGYANLFPLLLKMLQPDSPRLGPLLKQIADPAEFWTPYGLRSISTLSPYYNAWNSKGGSPYWRGPIWINMNYFAVAALKHYSLLEGPHQDTCVKMYADLRTNLLSNVANEFGRTGFLWEHYNDVSGHGEGNHPFTGWTVLILKVLTESY